ncbi:CRISPR-associated endonuclease Cas2 [Candidatus Micrarchaeota archaeon]|nr:CRISPR-associated endonuclease Cas2 [Candidatus Micrarchaeota archaeon]
MKYVVSYDVVDDRMRARVAKCLEDYGDRVQKSVFEVDIGVDRLARMCKRLEKLIDHEEDSVRIYPVCNTCLEKVNILGVGEVLRDRRVTII